MVEGEQPPYRPDESARAYFNILASGKFKHFYIDGFTGGPMALRK